MNITSRPPQPGHDRAAGAVAPVRCRRPPMPPGSRTTGQRDGAHYRTATPSQGMPEHPPYNVEVELKASTWCSPANPSHCSSMIAHIIVDGTEWGAGRCSVPAAGMAATSCNRHRARTGSVARHRSGGGCNTGPDRLER